MEKLHEDINTACVSLEGLGCDSVVLIASPAGFTQFGSQKGRQFLEENFVIVTDFIQYCRDGPQEQEVPTTDLIGKDLSVSSKPKTGSLVVKMRVYGDKLVPIADQPVTNDGIPFKFASQTNTDSIGDTVTGEESDTMMSDKYDSYDDELEMDMPESTDKQKTKVAAFKNSDIEKQPIEVKTESIDPDEDDNDLVNNLAELVGEKKNMQTKINSHGKPATRSARRKAGVDKTKISGIDDSTRDGDLIEDVSDLKAVVKKEPTTGAMNFKCDNCNKAFKSLSRLQTHIKLHTEQKGHPCKVCGATFLRQSKLRKHERVHSNERPYKCDVCFKGFKHLHNMYNHKRLHDPDKSFICDTCGKQFAVERYLEEHKRIHTGAKPYMCVVCNKGFRTSSELSKHRRRSVSCISSALKSLAKHNGDETVDEYACNDSGEVKLESMATLSEQAEPILSQTASDTSLLQMELNTTLSNTETTSSQNSTHQCTVCNKSFKTKKGLKAHGLLHSSVSSYICPVCGKGFRTYQGLWHHKTVHLDKSFTCETCGASFKSRKDLLRHQLRHKTDKPFVCDTCGMRFVTNFFLNRHRKKHTDLAVLFCDVCMKSFHSSHLLTIHKRLHTGERPFLCETCGKAFRDQGTCKEHQLTHSTEKTFACEICPQRFITMKRLNKHKSIHDIREKRFSCETCGNLFYTKQNLTKHQQLHGEKQYPCALCSKMFVSLRDKNLHQVAHTREKLYSCDFCDKKFTCRSYVSKHRRVHTHEKPYACSRCELKFFSPSALARHMKRHIDKDQAGANNSVRPATAVSKAHQKKTYTCSICMKQLKSMYTMKEHAKKLHPNASEVLAIVS